MELERCEARILGLRSQELAPMQAAPACYGSIVTNARPEKTSIRAYKVSTAAR